MQRDDHFHRDTRVSLMLLLLAGCLLDKDGYLAARALLTDDDEDGMSESEGDCDDANVAAYPGAPEGCDDLDNDCNGLTDEAGGGALSYPDDDHDGYGDADRGVDDCVPPTGYVTLAGDCEDGLSSVHPQQNETCDGVDEDCDGVVDDDVADAPQWYVDADLDGHAVGPDNAVRACAQPAGYTESLDELDCDDADGATYPGAPEVCGDGVVNDCDSTDECRYLGSATAAGLTIFNDFDATVISAFEGPEYTGKNLALLWQDPDTGVRGVEVFAGPVSTSGALSTGGSWALPSEVTPSVSLGDADSDGEDDLLVVTSVEGQSGLYRLGLSGGDLLDQPSWVASYSETLRSAVPGYWEAAVWVTAGSRTYQLPAASSDGQYELGDLSNLVESDVSYVNAVATCSAAFGDDYLILADGDAQLSFFDATAIRGSVSIGDAAAIMSTDARQVSFDCPADIDGDGRSDLLVRMPFGTDADPTPVAFLVTEWPPPSGATVVASATSTVYNSPNDSNWFGVGGASGDLDDDGHPDIVLSAPLANASEFGGGDSSFAGCAVIFYGPHGSGALEATDSENGVFCGAENTALGVGVAAAKDLTADGVDDLVATSQAPSPDGIHLGVTYIIPGLTN